MYYDLRELSYGRNHQTNLGKVAKAWEKQNVHLFIQVFCSVICIS